jgi:hypothetical protein
VHCPSFTTRRCRWGFPFIEFEDQNGISLNSPVLFGGQKYVSVIYFLNSNKNLIHASLESVK